MSLAISRAYPLANQAYLHRLCWSRFYTVDAEKLSANCGIKLSTFVSNRLQSNPYLRLEPFIKSAALAAQELPQALRSVIYDFKKDSNPQGYILIRKLPGDENLMDTPVNLAEVPFQKKTFRSEFWLTGIGSLLGDPFTYIQENAGNLFHNVRPARNKAEALSSESSVLDKK